ncbi:MAG: hypothetical protein ABIU77_03390 [Ferruginibacter sp.]
MYTIINNDGSAVTAAAYSISGNQINFNVRGNYRITCVVPAGANNDLSTASSEIKV